MKVEFWGQEFPCNRIKAGGILRHADYVDFSFTSSDGRYE